MNTQVVVQKIDRVILVGKEEYPERKTSFYRQLQSYELIFHFSGQSTIYFDDKVLKVVPGVIRFLPKSDGEHYRYDVVRESAGECIDIFFQAEGELPKEAFLTDAKDNERIARLFRRIFATWVAKEKGYMFDCVAILYQIFAEMQRLKSAPNAHYEKIKPALLHIHQNFLTAPLRVGDLAALCHMKESYFNRLFREKYGMSPKKYIISLKINYASELLRFGSYTVTQVAEVSGFSDVYYFSRQFKEYMGITPSQFVREYRSSK